MFRNGVLAALCLTTPALASAGMITIDPDDYLAGTDLSLVSSLVTLSTSGGTAVYASGVYPRLGSPQPSEVTDTGPLGKHVFSRWNADNTEWWAWPDYYGLDVSVFDPAVWAIDPDALVISFTNPVDYASLLAAEIIGDASGAATDDPVRWWVYDSTDHLIMSSYVDDPAGVIAYLGTEDWGDGPMPAYPVWRAEFSHPDIRRIVIGGESEPTTLDRLQFRTIDVPEPATGILFLTAVLAGTALRRRSVRPSSN
jgi:hypothetical protein